jgi:hypothetical protein
MHLSAAQVALIHIIYSTPTTDPCDPEVSQRLRTVVSHQYLVHHPPLTPLYRAVAKSKKKTNVLSAVSKCPQEMRSARHTSRPALAAGSRLHPRNQLQCRTWALSRQRTHAIPIYHLLLAPRPLPTLQRTLGLARCRTALVESSHTSLLKKTAWMATGASRNARFAWKSSNPARRWADWSVSASFIGSASETGGESKAGAVAPYTSSTSEKVAQGQAQYPLSR